jgi:hypothetical protein
VRGAKTVPRCHPWETQYQWNSKFIGDFVPRAALVHHGGIAKQCFELYPYANSSVSAAGRDLCRGWAVRVGAAP